MNEQVDVRISRWIQNLQTKGKFAFSMEMLIEELPNYTAVGYKRALNRLSAKKQIVSVFKGYYLIVPLQYASKGILPPALFVDALMNHLERPYYLALLNAASFYGSSHQQPQEFFVITCFPVIRTTLKKGLKINYISKNEIPENLLETKKTESGYLKISNPALTACDLIQFERRVGGLNRVTAVLSELTDAITREMFNNQFIKHASVAALQRLGFILERILNNKILADALFKAMEKSESKFFRVPLKASAAVKGFSSDDRWKVIINTKIEIDE